MGGAKKATRNMAEIESGMEAAAERTAEQEKMDRNTAMDILSRDVQKKASLSTSPGQATNERLGKTVNQH